MKHLYILLSLCFVLCIHTSQAQWQWYHPKPHGNATQATDFYDSNHARSIGKQYSETYNNGNWTINSACDTNLAITYVGLDLVDSVDGWAIESQGKIYRGDSAGWHLYGDAHNTITDLFMVDKNNGWIVGDSGNVYKYDGVSWSLLPTSLGKKLWGVYFLNDSTGWVTGENGTFMQYRSGNWSVVNTGINISSAIYGLFAIDTLNIWVSVSNGNLLHCNNGVWSQLSGPWVNSPLRKMHFTDATHGWGIGLAPIIYAYDGTNWNAQYTDTNVYNGDFQTLRMITAQDGWVTGLGGIKLHWNGTNWTEVTESAGTEKLLDVYAVDSTHVYACGTQALYAMKGGKMVNQFTPTVGVNWNDLDFMNEHFGVAVRNTTSATVAFCRDSVWTLQSTGLTGGGYNAVEVVDSTHVWAVGPGGIIDFYDGTSWTRQTSGTTANLNSVYFIDANVGYAVGNGGVIKKYVNGTWSTYTFLANNTENLVGICMIDSTHGWAFTRPTSTTLNVYKTINGNWAQRTLPAVTIPAGNRVPMEFRGLNDGWAQIGANNAYLRCNGTSWYLVRPNVVYGNVYSGHRISAQEAYLCGDAGAILRVDSFTTVVGLSEAQLNNHFQESGKSVFIYPNPADAATSLHYVREHAGTTTLRILDITGRILVNLVEKKEGAGVYEVPFNTAQFRSGVYLYYFSDGVKEESGRISVTH